MSELESVRIQFLPILKEIGKCQNSIFAHFERNWKVSELESVRIGKCQNPIFAHFERHWKVSELESVRIGMKEWKVSELE